MKSKELFEWIQDNKKKLQRTIDSDIILSITTIKCPKDYQHIKVTKNKYKKGGVDV